MKKLFMLVMLFSGITANTQELPTEPAEGFSFPLGSKFTIKPYPADSTTFNYSVTAFEPFHEIIDIWDHDSLFADTGKRGTIEMYFCLGTKGETEEEREKNMKVLLIIKNRTPYAIAYTSEIQIKEGGEYQETSNSGWFPGAKGMEIWSDMIYSIGIRELKRMQ